MKQVISAGSWKMVITPHVGITMAGSLSEQRAAEILDDLYVNAVVFDDGIKEAAVVSVDVCHIHSDIFKDIAKGIEAGCGIPFENISVTATHTHNGPLLDRYLPEMGEVDADYLEYFKKNIVTSVCMAKKHKQPVRIGAGRGINDSYIFNRRLKKPDGSIVMAWADRSFTADCTGDGVTDPGLLVLKIENMAGDPVAFIVNYACHNHASGGLRISSDFSGHMAKTLQKVYGKDLAVLFLQGAAGNIVWLDYRDTKPKDPHLYMKIGEGLAGTVLEIASKLEYPEICSMGIENLYLSIPDRPFCEYDIRADNTFGPPEKSGSMMDIYRREKERSEGAELPVNAVNVHVLKLGGDIAIASTSGEIFVEFGLEVKAKSPFKYTLFTELTNGYSGYVCTAQAFREGGYEVRKLNNTSHLAKDAGERIVDASLELLKKA